MEEELMKNVKEAVSIMKKAYDTYNTNAQKNIDKDEATYWHWVGIAEGTRRSWELLEELLGLVDEQESVECDGRCLNCNNYDTDNCPDKH